MSLAPPLSAGGLWLAVTITPAAARVPVIENARTGVGTTCGKSSARTPRAAHTRAVSSANASLLRRASYPMITPRSAASGIVALVVRRVGLLMLAGVVLGGVSSLWLSKYVQAMLFRLDARDPATFLAAAGVLVLAAAIAAWLPARRAAHVDPAQVLREG